jgi:hypothetical protein
MIIDYNNSNSLQICSIFYFFNSVVRVRFRRRRGKASRASGGAAGQYVRVSW